MFFFGGTINIESIKCIKKYKITTEIIIRGNNLIKKPINDLDNNLEEYIIKITKLENIASDFPT